MKRSTLAIVAAALLFAGILLWSTLAAQQVECSACVTLNGVSNCATASAKDTTEALHSAVNTACGTLAKSMDERIRCANLPPERPYCRTR